MQCYNHLIIIFYKEKIPEGANPPHVSNNCQHTESDRDVGVCAPVTLTTYQSSMPLGLKLR